MNLTNASSNKNFRAGLLAVATVVAAFAPAFASAQADNQSPLVKSMGITQKLGDQVPVQTEFKDESGKTVHFGDLLHKRPVILVPIFYQCKTSCPVIAEGMIKTLAKANKGEDKMVIGRDLDVVMLSIHPKETPDLAMAKKQFYLDALAPPKADDAWRKTTASGWHFLTGDYASIRKVTDSIGLKYSYNEQKDLINHPMCTVILTPDAKVSSYTIGNDFPTKVVEDDLALAAQGKIGEQADQSMMFGCVMLDPVTHKYRVVVENVLKLASALTLLVLVTSIVSMSLKSKREERLKSDDSGLGVRS